MVALLKVTGTGAAKPAETRTSKVQSASSAFFTGVSLFLGVGRHPSLLRCQDFSSGLTRWKLCRKILLDHEIHVFPATRVSFGFPPSQKELAEGCDASQLSELRSDTRDFDGLVVHPFKTDFVLLLELADFCELSKQLDVLRQTAQLVMHLCAYGNTTPCRKAFCVGANCRIFENAHLLSV